MKTLSIGITFLCAALLCGQALAGETDYDAGTDALPLQYTGGGARAAAMGSAVVAVPQGAASLFWNPAALSRMSCTELGLHHLSGLGDTTQESAVYGLPLGPVKNCEKNCTCTGGALGGLAASLSYVDYGTFHGRDTVGLPTDNYHARDYTGNLGWGMELLPGFSGGLVLKADQSEYPDKTYYSYAADVGFLYAVSHSVDLGLTYSNIKLGSNMGSLTSGWRLGGAWTVDKHLLLALSSELQNSAMDRLQVGAEYLIGNTEEIIHVLALRAGYQVNYPNPQLSGFTNLTLGVGYTLSRDMALDYAMVPDGELGTTHRFSLTLKFDCPKPKPVALAAAPAPSPAPAPAPVEPAPPIVVVSEPEPVVVREIILEDSHFDFDSSVLRPSGMAVLKENVELLKENPKQMVKVAGYTSMRGTEEYNQKLSERRAGAVAAYLLSEGIAQDRITTIGYGETRPAEQEVSATKAQENSPAAQANKRVVFTVTVK